MIACFISDDQTVEMGSFTFERLCGVFPINDIVTSVFLVLCVYNVLTVFHDPRPSVGQSQT